LTYLNFAFIFAGATWGGNVRFKKLPFILLKCKMKQLSSEQFGMYWDETEIVRKYQRTLSALMNMELPYVVIGEHHLGDRAFVFKGNVFIQQPSIIIPTRDGPQFEEGFDVEMPKEFITLLRNIGVPYTRIRNQIENARGLEYGGLQQVTDKYYEEMAKREDTETGLISGKTDGAHVSLMKYSVVLAAESAPRNIAEMLEKLKLGGPGGDISRLF